MGYWIDLPAFLEISEIYTSATSLKAEGDCEIHIDCADCDRSFRYFVSEYYIYIGYTEVDARKNKQWSFFFFRRKFSPREIELKTFKYCVPPLSFLPPFKGNTCKK